MSVPTRPIGNRGYRIPALGQGCGGGSIRCADDLNARVRSLRFGIENGLTFLDTAEAYHGGQSEIAVGRAIAGRRDEVYLASKVSPKNLAPADLIVSLEQTLRRLGTDYLDLYQIHWSNSQIPIEATLGCLEEMVDAGKIREIGVCNFSRKEIRQALDVAKTYPISSVQSEYNLFDRSVEAGLWPDWLGFNRVFIAYSPLEQGSLTGGAEQRATLQALADKYEATAAQLALAWIVSHPGVVAIPRSVTEGHIAENARAAELCVSGDDLDLISRTFSAEPRCVDPKRIRVATDGLDNRAVYQTREEAIANALGMTPSPAELARDIADGEFLKPVRVRPTTDDSGRYDYDLIEGRLRYWAWVLAFDGVRPIHVLIRNH